MILLVAMPALIGVAACAVDLSLMSAAGQRVQNVVDQAAISGARSYANEATARGVVEQVVAANNSASTWQVVPETQCYGPGDTVPGYGVLGEEQHVVDVTGHARFDFAFGRLLGLETTEVYRRAAARLQIHLSGGGGAFIFAGASGPGIEGVKIMGQGTTIEGDIQANSDVRISGLNVTMNGDLAHSGDVLLTGRNFSLNGDQYQTAPAEYPLDYTWEQFDQGPWDYEVPSLSVSGRDSAIPSGRWRIHGDMTVSGNGATCLNAIFVVDGNVTVSASNKNFDGVTIIAQGEIRMSGAGSRYSPYEDNLLALSFLGDSSVIGEQGISINASDCEITGITYAPYANISINGAREQTYHIGVVGETVDLMGSHSTFAGPATNEEEGDIISDVRLIL